MIRAILLWLVLALPAAAQSLPDWEYTSINDFAGLLTNDDTRILDQALIALHDETGVEGTVVTLNDRASHGGNTSLESFATRLFNYWGVGDKRRNDGFMILILKDDRETRIELGAGYPSGYDSIASGIMNDVMLPDFRNNLYSAGLRDGTLAVIAQIARPHSNGIIPERPPRSAQGAEESSFTAPMVFLGIFAVLFVLIFIYVFRHIYAQMKAPFVPTPVAYLDENGEYRSNGAGLYSSGWDSGSSSSSDSFSSSSSSSSGYGGGSSSGGGASGKW